MSQGTARGTTQGLTDTELRASAVPVDGSGVTQPVSNAGTFAVQAAVTAALAAIVDGAIVTLGAKADAKNTATDTTALTVMQVIKQISASVQAPPSQAVTNAGTFAVQAAEADGANVTLGAKADAKSTATDTTPITVMSVLKQISASAQAPPSQAVTNAGTFAVQAAVTAALSAIVDGAIVTLGAKADAKSTATDTTAITIMQVLKQISASVQAPPGTAVTNAGTFAVQGDITKLNGTATDTNSGNKSAGTLRVVLATDQPALTNKLLVTPDANSAVNVAQWNGVAPTTATALSDTFGNPTAPPVGACAMEYDVLAGSWFRKPSYIGLIAALASASRAAGTIDTTITMYGLKRIIVYVNITVNGGSTLTVAINDATSGFRLATPTTGLTANAGTVYQFGEASYVPGGGTTNIAQSFPLIMPGKFVLRVTTTATSTFSISYELVP